MSHMLWLPAIFGAALAYVWLLMKAVELSVAVRRERYWLGALTFAVALLCGVLATSHLLAASILLIASVGAVAFVAVSLHRNGRRF